MNTKAGWRRQDAKSGAYTGRVCAGLGPGRDPTEETSVDMRNVVLVKKIGGKSACGRISRGIESAPKTALVVLMLGSVPAGTEVSESQLLEMLAQAGLTKKRTKKVGVA